MLYFISAFPTLLVSFCLTVNSLCISSKKDILNLLQANYNSKCQFDASYTICDRQQLEHFDVYSTEISIHAIKKEIDYCGDHNSFKANISYCQTLNMYRKIRLYF
jgi:hypothetical protein